MSVVGTPRPHESAHLHVAGAAPYIDDLPELAGTLHAALGLSPVAHGTLRGIDLAALRARPGVVAVFTAADIPGTNDCGPIIHDDPILADGEVRPLDQRAAEVPGEEGVLEGAAGQGPGREDHDAGVLDAGGCGGGKQPRDRDELRVIGQAGAGAGHERAGGDGG